MLGKGDQQIYVGLDAQRFSKLAVDSGAYTDDVIDVDQGVLERSPAIPED